MITDEYYIEWGKKLLDGKSIKVYSAFGTMQGMNTFDLTDWETGNGGEWEYWYVEDGFLNTKKEK